MCEHTKHKNFLFLRCGLSIAAFIIGFKFSAAFVMAYLIMGYDILFKAFKNILKGEIFDECFLMSIATIGALYINELPEAVMVMLLYQIGEYLQDKAIDKSKASIIRLMNIKPDFANIITNDKIERIKPENVKIGDIILVKAGEKIPLDGIVKEGCALIDLSSLTGESMPERVEQESIIYSGSINLDGVLKIQVTKSFKESTVSKIIELVEHAKNKKSKSENFITKFAKIYTPIVVFLAVFVAIVPQIFLEGNWLERALTFLVISCPCALVISIPLSFFAGIGSCSKTGILIKGSVYLEKLSNIKSAVFDKTGTLTKGNFEVTEINSNNLNILKYAAMAEACSNHPIAKAIKAAYGNELSEIPKATEYAGMGIKAMVNGKEVICGNAKLVNVEPIDTIGTVVYVSLNGEYIGNIIISDTLKPDAKLLISELNKKNISTIMLTGDNEKTARNVQMQLGIKTLFANLLPDQKVEKLEEIMLNSSNTIFVGDGINDAPVLQRANVGIAMGGLGSDAAIEASDIVIMDDKPSKILDAIIISKKTMLIVKENIIFAISVKLLFLILGTLGFMTMWGAVFADVGVTFIAILNALRIRI